MKTLYTDRLVLRKFQQDDLADFYEYAKQPEVGPNAGWKPHESLEESQHVLDMFLKSDEVLAIVHTEDNKVIGSIGLHKDNTRTTEDCKEVGYVLSKDYWGRGLMPEAVKRLIRHAFDDLGLNLLAVCPYDFNNNSKRVIEKCGFVYEGTLRRAVKMYNDNIYDLCCYSMTRDDYNNL